MAAFPILESFDIHNYGLYPGANKEGTITLTFLSGLTLILGANGLGKTTLITMLFRMLTGPFDLILPSGSIGTSELKATALGRHGRTVFGARVNDAAVNANATLTFSLGNHKFKITRSLYDLSLKSFSLSDQNQNIDEFAFQKEILTASQFATFGEWILVLRTMVFFFEDRRALVWDTSAQRQLLRCLLLPAAQANQWAKAEREILELDTRMRNLQAALRREQRDTAEIDRRTEAAPGVTAALRAAEAAAEHLREQQNTLTDILETSDKNRHKHRLDALRAQAEHDSAIHELERARLIAVESRFPTVDASMRYIFARIMSDDECLVCRTPNRIAKRDALVEAIEDRRCVVCDTQLPTSTPVAIEIDDTRVDALRAKVTATLEAVIACKTVLSETTKEYEDTLNALTKCAADIADRREQINALVNQLPPEERVARR